MESRRHLTRVAASGVAVAVLLAPAGVGAASSGARGSAVADDDGAAKNKSERTWIKHEVIAGDLIAALARRYGVTRSELIRWNKLDPERPVIVIGRSLRVYAKIVPPPRERRVHVVVKGDSWSGIASKYDVSQRVLRRWNPKYKGRRSLYVGNLVIVWLDGTSTVQKKVTDEPLPLVPVKQGARSIGAPTSGRIYAAAPIPENKPLYTVLRPRLSFGATHSIEQLQLGIARFRRDYTYGGRLVISSMSREGGGRLKPHRSHQSGRDVDIRLPLLAGLSGSLPKSYDEVDWSATWGLVKSLIDTEQVVYIFLNHSAQRRLFRAAKRAGMSETALQPLIQYPQSIGKGSAVVRHSKGHDKHFHVRFKCGSSEDACRERR